MADTHSSLSRLEGEVDSQLRRQIIHHAQDLVHGDFSETTQQCFVRATLQGQAYGEVAAGLGLTDNAVRHTRFRVLQRLREELGG